MGIADKLFQMKNEKVTANLKAGQAFLEANKKNRAYSNCRAVYNTK